ncbi:MAG: tetraacyldisaccharide 4'-kinase [Neisseria sp.]|nr:tetraacyldisaccharide 4'-kinase [Neisseria sp.]
MKLHQILEQHWRQPNRVLNVLLHPLSCLFGVIAKRRRRQFLRERDDLPRLNVPVVVVGNIHVGGVGKTPIVASLVKSLQAKGLKVGIISRGYGREEKGVHLVNANSTAAQAGDEPLMLWRQTGAPMAVAAKRLAAGQALQTAHSDLDIIIADDGLQHYGLWRDLEIVVFPYADSERDDLALLPKGALREPVNRLVEADVLVLSNCPEQPTSSESSIQNRYFSPENTFYSHIETGDAYRLNNPSEKADLCRLQSAQIAALAGIAQPERFFQSLEKLGLQLSERKVLPDHAALTTADLPRAEAVFITEKDAVKLQASEATNHVWVLPIEAKIEPDLADFVVQKLRIR